MMHNYQMLIAYDGTHYHGWQVQPNGMSIQETLQNILKTILRKHVTVIGSGRTDAGVHAQGQVANFQCEEILDLFRLRGSLNGLLPPDIRVKEITEVSLDFHARYSAIRKAYHYRLHLDRIQDPFTRLYKYHVKSPIDVDLLKKAALLFTGTHDFTAFANESHMGSAAKDPVRTIYSLNIVEEDGGVRLEFEADGFLYRMVRNITGTLLEIASRKRDIDDVPKLFENKDRRRTGQAAPAQGLVLIRVDYPLDLLTISHELHPLQ